MIYFLDTPVLRFALLSYYWRNIAGVDDDTNIPFQTAKVEVKNCENSYINSIRVLLDSCSQLSYIIPQLLYRLKLKTVGTRKILIQTFGNNCSEKF